MSIKVVAYVNQAPRSRCENLEESDRGQKGDPKLPVLCHLTFPCNQQCVVLATYCRYHTYIHFSSKLTATESQIQ